MPDLVQVGREFQAQGGKVLAVSQDLFQPGTTLETALPKVRGLATRLGMAFPILVYQAPDLDALNDRFDLPGPIPATVAINAQGVIVDRENGGADAERLRAMMQKALGR